MSEPEATLAAPLLRLRGIEKHFGAVQALDGVDLDVPMGQVTALVGDNGAGKSVLIKTIAGIHGPDAGEIVWEGRPVRIHSPRDAAALGIEVVYQDLALCDNLDVVENMFLGRERLHHHLLDEDDMERAAARTLAELQRHHRALGPAGGRQPFGRPAPVGRGRQGGDVELQAGDPRRADGGTRRRADAAGAATGAPAGRPGPRRDHDLAQPERRVRGRRPDRRAAARADGRRRPGGGIRSAARGRADDDRARDAARRSCKPRGRGGRVCRGDAGGTGRRRAGACRRGQRACRRRRRAKFRRLRPGHVGAGAGRPERGVAGRARRDPDRADLPDPERDVPVGRQSGEPARAGLGVHADRDGRRVRAAGRRDGPLARLRRRDRRHRGDRTGAAGLRVALVGRHTGRARGDRGARRGAGHADHAAPAAVVHRHAGRAARLRGRDDRAARHRRHDPDRGRHHRRPRERHAEPDHGLGADGGAGARLCGADPGARPAAAPQRPDHCRRPA